MRMYCLDSNRTHCGLHIGDMLLPFSLLVRLASSSSALFLNVAEDTAAYLGRHTGFRSSIRYT